MNRKTMKYSALALSVAIGLVACNSKKNEAETEENKVTNINKTSTAITPTGDAYIWPDSLKNIFAVPDSIMRNPEKVGPNWSLDKIWTPEEKALAKLIMRTFIENVEIKHGKLAFTITPEEYAAKGIPEPYYYMFNQSLKTFGAGKSDIEVVQLWEKRKENIRKQYFQDEK